MAFWLIYRQEQTARQRLQQSNTPGEPQQPILAETGLIEQLRIAQAEIERQAATIEALMVEIGRGTTKQNLQQTEIVRLTDLVATLRAASAGNSAAGQDPRFRALRALIMKELHPDHAPPNSTDRALRGEVWKALWPKIEAITGRAG